MPGSKKTSTPRAIAESFGHQLRRYRTNQGLSQEDLAAKSGVSVGTISSAEHERGKPRPETVLKLAKALKLGGLAHGRFIAPLRRVVPPASTVAKRTPAKTVAIRNRRSLQVFLCHASEDKLVVRELYKKLKREPGIKPWLDEIDLLGGQNWDSEIRKSVRASGTVVVCLSRVSIKKEGYVQKELRVALDVADEKPEGTIFIIPMRLEQCEIPLSLRQYHCLDYYQSDGFTKLLRSLRARIRERHSALNRRTSTVQTKPRRATGKVARQ